MHKTMLLMTLLLGACTREQSLEHAKTNEVRAEQKVAQEQAALAAQQEKQRDQLAQAQVKDQVALEARQDAQVARLDRKQQEEQATLLADHRQLLAGRKGKLMRAGVRVAEARIKIEAEARERLEKIEARARELSAKTGRVADDAQVKVREGWATFATKHAEAVDAVKTLKKVTDVSLASWETEVDRRFAELDSTLSKIEHDLK